MEPWSHRWQANILLLDHGFIAKILAKDGKTDNKRGVKKEIPLRSQAYKLYVGSQTVNLGGWIGWGYYNFC